VLAIILLNGDLCLHMYCLGRVIHVLRIKCACMYFTTEASNPVMFCS
jgi:hypothetical protein